VFGLLPGSRPSEIARHLPPMLEAARRIAAEAPGARFVVPVADGVDGARIERQVAASGLPARVAAGAFDLLASACDAAIAASGTATLELAVRDVPSVVVYRTSALTHAIARRIVAVPHVGLVNLVAGSEVLPELIQDAFTPDRAARLALQLGRPGPERSRALDALARVRSALGPPGAYDRAAAALLEVLDGDRGRRGESAP
ncbi:MAG: lipid-A-disaccharide synthase, partial [Acidobacteria bacterium]